jgi:hypothetical protein
MMLGFAVDQNRNENDENLSSTAEVTADIRIKRER